MRALILTWNSPTQESPLYEHYYAAMAPDREYVPFYMGQDVDDLVKVGSEGTSEKMSV